MSHLKMDLIDPDRLVKENELKEITNPVFFIRNSVPTPDGLLSNEIFGITKYDRANTFAYVDLHEYFLNPLIYKTWCKIDSNIKPCVHGIKNYIINSKGELEESEEGENGIAFLKKNISKIHFRRTTSRQRDMRVDFVKKYIDRPEIFIRKLIICPPYYRDINTESDSRVAIGEINKLYRNLLIFVKALKESSDYGLNLNSATRGRIQETLVQIYDWFGPGTVIDGQPTPSMIPGKKGVLHGTIMGKTADYASRLLITAPQLKVNKLEDIEADLDHSVIPLASACVNFLPFVMHHMKRFFENEFSGDAVLPYIDNDNKVIYLHPKDYQTEFSDDRLKKEIDRFVSGFSNRFAPVEVPTEEGKLVRLRFKGYNMSAEEYNKADTTKLPIMERDLTWCDVIFRAIFEAVKGKHVLITRYPMDSYFNQFPTKIKISSTVTTEPMVIDQTFYPHYPHIEQKDIGGNTSNKFIDSATLSNLYLDGIGGDYDGDQVTIKGIYSDEANNELEEHLKSPSHYFNLGGKGVRVPIKDAFQSIYNMTLGLEADKDKFTEPIF